MENNDGWVNVFNGYPPPPLPPPPPPPPVLNLIQQDEYRANAASSIYVSGLPSVQFLVNGGMGIRVVDALAQDYRGLDDPDAKLLEGMKNKVNVRIMIPGYASYTKPKYVRTTADCITRGMLATRVAEVVRDFVSSNCPRGPDGTPYLVVGDVSLRLDELILLAVEHVSKGSVQPVLAYLTV
ncbi:hypothetical protein BDW22DRAFT_1360146 [Trametopsis cervina]|nr:hypothetical protein BDW22DRAFT_1360146 [Trametopsis cervina]